MPYQVNFTDRENKVPITVFDNTSNEDTSLTIPGRNVTGYGQIIAENFVSLLENFASETAPANPIEGQLWYDVSNNTLQIYDSTNWKAASSIQKSITEPSVETANVGELWVDTINQQLYIFSGTRWILVGPNFSSGLRSGPIVEQIVDSDNLDRIILTFYIDDNPIFIVSKDTFTPKTSIAGFTTISSGLNITDSNVDVAGLDAILNSRAQSADALNISGTEVPATRFLRSDVVNTLEQGLNIRNNSGITLGADGNVSLSNTAAGVRLYNNSPGSSIDLQTNRDGTPSTVLRVQNQNIGINKQDPDFALDVVGDIALTGELTVSNTTESTNFSNGSIQTAGGVAVSKNLLVGTTGDIQGTLTTSNVEPRVTETYDSGTATKRWNTVRAKTIIADELQGVLSGNIVGNASTATNLRFATSFQLSGDVTSQSVQFDGQVGGLTKIFNTTLTTDIISGKSEPTGVYGLRSVKDDFVLVFRAGSGLLKVKRDNFIADLGVPIGTILPFAGANAPYGYLLCDGSEVERLKYQNLYDVISTTYGTPAVGFDTFVLPDLRGRFPLGRDNMDNGEIVPDDSGAFVDAGGGNADRVAGTAADNLGGSGGQSTNTLSVTNLPDHEHNMQGSTGEQYYAVRPDTANPLDDGASLRVGPTVAGQMQYLPSSGGVKTADILGDAFALMNPYLTINYIIRSGPPAEDYI